MAYQIGAVAAVDKRQSGEGVLNDTYPDYDGYYSPQWIAARYAILAVILLAIVIFFVGGYSHAQRRLRKGLPPLAYHSFMVRRQYQPQPQQPYYGHGAPQYAPGQEFPMQDHLPPPPYQPPPVYQPPVGATKVLPSQHVSTTRGEASGAPAAGAPVAGAASEPSRYT